jgi:transketolase
MRDTFVRTLLEIALIDPNVHIITGDLGFGVLKPFWESLPNQITNVGIAEQNMTGFATGMALEGKVVFTYSIGNFPTLRTLEQIRNDAAYHNANVKIVCVGGGFVYGSLGMSHHATEDIAIMRALPNVKVFAPGDLVEAELVTRKIYEDKGVCYLRLGRGGEKKIHNSNPRLEIGKAIKIFDGKNVAIFSTGAIFDEVIDSVAMLKEKGIFPTVYTFPTIKPIDIEIIKQCAKTHKIIVTVEEHNRSGGFYSAVSEILVGLKTDCQLLSISINDMYSSIVGDQKYLREVYKLNSNHIYRLVIENV